MAADNRRNSQKGVHQYTVQEAANLSLIRIVEVDLVTTDADHADDTVVFNWTEVPYVSLVPGKAVELLSPVIFDPTLAAERMELYWCQGSGDDGTAPTTAQRFGAIAGVIDITSAEAVEIGVCGSSDIKTTHAEGLAGVAHVLKGDISFESLIMAPAINSTSLYVAGVWRSNPADTDGTSMKGYFGFRG